MVKKTIYIFLFSIITLSLFSDEMTEVYSRLYFESNDYSQRYVFMNEILALNDPSTADLLGKALRDLISNTALVKVSSDREKYDALMRVILAGLGTFKARLYANDVFVAGNESNNPLVKAEAFLALGKMRAIEYTEKIAKILSDLNLEPSIDRDYGEKIAYGCIVSLEKMRDTNGFISVFNASNAWYSPRIIQLAEKVLPNIVDDPSDIVLTIIDKEDLEKKTAALKLMIKTKASIDKKNLVASSAIKKGTTIQTKDKLEASLLANFRKEAIRSLIQLNSKDAESVTSLKLAYDLGDQDEKLLVLSALGVNASDAAAKVLTEILLFLNEQRKDDLTDDRKDQLVKAALQNAGITKNSKVRIAVIAIKGNNKWSSSVLNIASDVLKTFN